MVGIDDERSKRLFNRHAALAIFATVARLPKEHFEPKTIQALTGATKDDVGRELNRLVSLGYVERVGRAGSGRYRRLPSEFWQIMTSLEERWDEEVRP